MTDDREEDASCLLLDSFLDDLNFAIAYIQVLEWSNEESESNSKVTSGSLVRSQIDV